MIRLAARLVLAVLILSWPVTARAFDVTLLHVNDSHSYLDPTAETLALQGKPVYARLGGWARLKSAVDAVRAGRGDVVLLHAGDAVQGGLYYMKYGGKPEMEFLDRLGFDAFVPGNHEFDRGAPYLARVLGYTKVPVVCANLDGSAVPALAARVRPYVIAERSGERIGIVGLITPETESISSPGEVRFTDTVHTATLIVRELQARGVNKIVLLTHQGFEADKRLAAEVPGVDVIVGGHSHTLLGNSGIEAMGLRPAAAYPTVVKGADGDDVYVVTAWKWGRVLGRLDLTFDDEGHVTRAEGKPLLILADGFKRKNDAGQKVALQGAERDELLAFIQADPEAAVVPADPVARKFLGPFSEGVEAMRTEVIGEAVLPLPHIRVPGTTDSGESLPRGSLIAPLVCRSMLARLEGTGEPADIALQNAGGVRESVDQGDITMGTAYTLLPFNNTLVLLELTGEQVRQTLETGVDRGGGAFLYAGGLRYTADMRRPEGERVLCIDTLDNAGNWTPLDPARAYRVVTNSYLASGGDGFDILKSAASSYDTGFVDAQAFIDYVRQQRMLKPLPTTGVTYIPAK
ncbi:NAD 5'-nucleotidase precursor [Pseudodesulfovibrio hydrargyri]|uniref:NAD 5'-nucleotidase n=1 Tax=Pseudodesulfovibrio hydrargyri TaxID=2125990 RepID=A0A1J5NBR4_9BACT|nr:5'-nucleotidase C-terminal domain-containing protein [Pseudodesulfovibrio hydrargyri]OIQ50655.1 NAD 5'-nucleotidase precursor [Pseudodesulfovibrio hydrargyri]